MCHLYLSYRKTTHPRRGGDQGWTDAEVSDTLNVFDNGETRTPILVVEYEEDEDIHGEEILPVV